jgi:rod shape determining protein RodA
MSGELYPRFSRRSLLRRVPWGLFGVALLVTGIGIGNLASASQVAHAPVWISQLVWTGIGFGLALALLGWDYEVLYRLAWPFWALVVVLLVAVEIRGDVVMGAQRWLVVGPLRLQPSELAKLSVILVLARIYEEDGERPEGYGLFELWKPALVVGVPAGLTLLQPDLGTAMMIVAVAATLVLMARVKRRTLALLGAGGIAAGALGWLFVLKEYQKRRVMAFLDPEADILGSGYHANQSMIAVGSGRWAGKGWGQGTQTQLSFLPEQHTDFVFSVFAEEWGFRGTSILLICFAAICLLGLRIAAQARDRHGAFLAVGAVALVFWHVMVNIGMVTGLLPVVGVTLPFMSYGRSSGLTVVLAVGLLANIGSKR